MNIIVFEDSGTCQLFPVTTGRPAYAITSGGYRLMDWLSELNGNLVGLVRDYLETIQLHDYPELNHKLDPSFKTTMLVNARLVPSVSNIQSLHQLADERSHDAETVVAQQGWAVAAALMPTELLTGKGHEQWRKIIDGLTSHQKNGSETQSSDTTVKIIETELSLFEYPHDVVDQNMICFSENLSHRIETGRFTQTQNGVFLGDGVKLSPHIVFDTSRGPIVLDKNVKIGPYVYFRGPVYIAPNSKVSEHASIKDKVSISHTCKIGGEVEASVIEPYSNKQHHGFLGHSYLGSWINLGAGTCNSDLKNTYGKVNMQYGEHKVATGMQFVGCVMGDYAKTAINTSIFTGKLVGTGSMVYGFATTNVPSFVNYARIFGEIGNLPAKIIVATQARMFARRDVVQRPCDVQLIHDMYRMTESERPTQLSSEPLSL